MCAIDFKNMNVQDRLQAMEALWDSFLTEETSVESPEWHKDILEKRKKSRQSGQSEYVSLKDLKASRNDESQGVG